MSTTADTPIAIAVNAPPPTPDEHSAVFWAGLAQRRIVIQVCASCDRRRFPRMPTCPYCGAVGDDDVEAAGTGTVYSFVRPQRALTPAYAELAPYAIATVELDGGGRMFGRVVPAEACAIGLRVTPDFADHPGAGAAAWTELVFRAAPDQP
ncbi:MAG: putative nucleic-acid-binding protein containing a Zn-ribbon [Ilumatobacteraceae bacterium]|nr:putative nucleic-acid-binding protein containing a Zn-ribbon [Ilumatobacteraceae bacterium]